MDRQARVATFAELAARILALPSERPRLVAVDGPGGAGKSIFATRLSEALDSAPIVHSDDFATGEPGQEWWPRLQCQVIEPLVAGRPARYQRYDWERQSLVEWRGNFRRAGLDSRRRVERPPRRRRLPRPSDLGPRAARSPFGARLAARR